jgi:hypothetical protein
MSAATDSGTRSKATSGSGGVVSDGSESDGVGETARSSTGGCNAVSGSRRYNPVCLHTCTAPSPVPCMPVSCYCGRLVGLLCIRCAHVLFIRHCCIRSFASAAYVHSPVLHAFIRQCCMRSFASAACVHSPVLHTFIRQCCMLGHASARSLTAAAVCDC